MQQPSSRIIKNLPLLTVTLSAACLPPDDADSDITARSIAVSNSWEADGPIVSVEMISAAGDLICKKTKAGEAFSSDGKDPRVQLYIDNELRETIPYEAGDAFIAFETKATDAELDLPPGPHTAFCTALPDLPFSVDGTKWIKCKSENGEEVCTKSGTLKFNIIEAPTPDVPANATSMLQKGNCGSGGSGNANNLCTGWANLNEGHYAFSFNCLAGEKWKVDLTTRRPESEPNGPKILTTLRVFEEDGTPHGPSKSAGAHDIIEFTAQDSGKCQALVSLEADARIKLMLTSSGLGPGEHCWERKLDVQHLPQENNWTCGVQNVRMWLKTAYDLDVDISDVTPYTGVESGTNMSEMAAALSGLSGGAFWRVGYENKYYAAKDLARAIDRHDHPVAIVGTFPRNEEGCRGKHFYLVRGYRACVTGGKLGLDADASFPHARIEGFYLEDTVFGSEFYTNQGDDKWATNRELVPVEDVFDRLWEHTGCFSYGACLGFVIPDWLTKCDALYWSVQYTHLDGLNGMESKVFEKATSW